jgi:hypothetical protein
MIGDTDAVLTYLGTDPQTASPADVALVAIMLPHVNRLCKRHVGYEIEQQTWTEIYPDKAFFRAQDPLVDAWEASQSGRITAFNRYSEDTRILLLRQLPVRSVQAVYEYLDAQTTAPPTFPPSSLLVNGEDYWSDEYVSGLNETGILFRQSGGWSKIERTIQVTYTAGWMPAELLPGAIAGHYTHAVCTACQLWFGQVVQQRRNMRTGGAGGAVVSEGVAGWTTAYDQASQNRLYGMMQRLPPAVCAILESQTRMSQYI